MRRSAVLAPLLGCVLIGIAAGCGGETVASPAPETVIGTVEQPAPPAAGPEGDPAAGKEIFASAGCGSCHTLADAGTSGEVGPNLDEAKPDLALALDRVTNGSGVMPSFKGQLDEQEIADVAAYVVEATQG
jgi:mono/diheme cytochrome c family protein